MNIPHSSHRRIYEAKNRNTAFYDLIQADDDLITQLTTFIDSLFSPLTWLLQQTLYRRIHKQDKGWIKIDFLHRNKKFQSIFKKFQIPAHCRSRKNFINKAIEKSMIKRKRNLIKRKKYLQVSEQVKKVVYLEYKGGQITEKTNMLHRKIMQNMMNEVVLRQLIGESLRGIIETRKQQQNPDKMQIQGQNKKHLDYEAIKQEIVFEGSLFKEQQGKLLNCNEQLHENTVDKQNLTNQVIYRWCFIYFPSLQQYQVKKLLSDLQNTFSSYSHPEKIELEQQMNKLNITESSIDKQQHQPHQKEIKIIPLTKMTALHYPKYTEMCQYIGYSQVDYRKQTLKTKQKQRLKQKERLLESRYIDDKIDLVNNYHVKLQIEKQKRSYWEKRNKIIEERIRKRQQRRKNRANGRIQQNQQKKDLTSKLKQLYNFDQPVKITKIQKHQEKPFKTAPQEINQKSIENEQMKNQIKQDLPSPQINSNNPGFKILLPKYPQSQANPSEINSESSCRLYVEQKKVQTDNFKEIYESDNQDHYDDMESSGEEFQLPKKKKKNAHKDSQTKKHKTIVKPSETVSSSRQKKENVKSSALKSAKIPEQNSTTRNDSTNGHSSHLSKNLSNSNTSYNLRHKSPSQGSYLKMAGYSMEYNQSNKKKEKNQIYEDDEDEKYDQSSSRNMRSRRS